MFNQGQFRWLAVFVAVAGFVVTSSSAWAARGAGVRLLSSPPASIRSGEHLKLGLKASRKPTFLFARDGRRDRLSVRARARTHLRRGRGTAVVVVPRSLAPGAWFVLACSTRRHCAVSRTPGVVALKRPGRIVNVSPGLASGRAVSETIGPAGGSLRATGPNGTKYVLSVPANSLAQNTLITMTPIDALSGASFAGKLVGGVQFAPEGLLLFRGAILTVTPTHRVPAARLVPLGYSASGADLHLVLALPAGGSIKLPIAHFSGGVIGNSPGGPGGAPAASDNAGFYGQMLAQLVADWGDGALSESEFATAAKAVLDEFYSTIMAEEVPPGLNEDAAATVAIRDLLSYARAYDLVLGQSVDDAVFQTVIKLVRGVYHRAQQRCATNHDISEISNHIIPDARQLELLGVPEIPFSELFSCLRFKVEIDSQIHFDPGVTSPGTTGGYDWHYESTVPLKLDAQASYDPGNQSPPIDGSATGTYVSASGSQQEPNACGTGTESYKLTGTQGDSVNVSALSFSVSGQAVTNIKLAINTGASENYYFTDTDSSCNPSDSVTMPLWWDEFEGGAFNDGYGTVSADGQPLVIPLASSGGQVFAQQTIPASSALGDSGFTTITVIHDPPTP